MKKFLLTIFIMGFCCAGTVFAATLTVSSNKDDGSAGSLRGVLATANKGDKIIFSLPYKGKTITLQRGELRITKDITIDGNDKSSPIPVKVTIAGNQNSRIFRIDNDVNTAISNLNIVNGKVEGFYSGGGIYNAGNLTLNNCDIKNNTAEGVNIGGGGIFNTNNATLTMSECNITGNNAEIGAGIQNGKPEESKSNTSNNYMLEIPKLIVNNCTFENNGTTDNYNSMCNYGGAIFTIDNSYIELNNCNIIYNEAIVSGGGIQIGIDKFESEHNNNTPIAAEINNCNITENTVGDNLHGEGGYGGGIAIYNASVDIKNCKYIDEQNCGIYKNTASLMGGGIYNAGKLTITKSSINNNQTVHLSGDGGGIKNYGTLALKDSEILYNHAVTGGGISSYSYDTENLIDNCTISGNIAVMGAGIQAGDDVPIKKIDSFANHITIKDSRLENNYTSGVSPTVSHEGCGGGVVAYNALILFEGNSSSIKHNAATDGGGIYLINSKLSFKENTYIQNNTARFDGGGIYLDADSSYTGKENLICKNNNPDNIYPPEI